MKIALAPGGLALLGLALAAVPAAVVMAGAPAPAGGAAPPADAVKPADAANPADPIDRLLHDYIALYAKDTLDAWRALFHPAFVAAFTNDDGSTTARTLDQFLERQRNYFASGRAIREELRDVTIERDGPLATVRAGFVLHDGDTAKPGRLMMLLLRDRDRYLIQSLVFTYHPDRP